MYRVFQMFSVITNTYNKKTKGPTLMKLLTATGKLKKSNFLQLEMFDVCTAGDRAHIDAIFKLLPHTRHQEEHYETPCIRKPIKFSCNVILTHSLEQSPS